VRKSPVVLTSSFSRAAASTAATSTTGSERNANSYRSFFGGRPDVVTDLACDLRVAGDHNLDWAERVCVQDLFVSAAEWINDFYL
jgi:hypothetical protein